MSTPLHYAAQQNSSPLLSICIPTYNRAGFLRVMLQALLPQVRECAEQVEVWVLDNASTDATQLVLEESRVLGPFAVHRQTSNIGPTRNIIQGSTELARGEYCWVLGDHNLLRPKALQRVLQFIHAHRSFDAIYVNFRCATFPTHWPDTATSGYDGDFAYLGNPELTSERIDRWTDLLRPYSAACTQNYVHIAKRCLWRNYWHRRTIGPDYTDALTTYPHTVTLLHSIGHLPAAVLIDPAITIFNGAQSWGNPETKFNVTFFGLADLLRDIEKMGLPGHQIAELRKHLFYPTAKTVILNLYRSRGRLHTLGMIANALNNQWPAWAVFLQTLPQGMFPRVTHRARRLLERFLRCDSWYLFNCRPARWLRNR
jgi:glycosyltransferase involved in cell wall biosynthesis